jgi:hypothetical protein
MRTEIIYRNRFSDFFRMMVIYQNQFSQLFRMMVIYQNQFSQLFRIMVIYQNLVIWLFENHEYISLRTSLRTSGYQVPFVPTVPHCYRPATLKLIPKIYWDLWSGFVSNFVTCFVVTLGTSLIGKISHLKTVPVKVGLSSVFLWNLAKVNFI